MELNDKLYWGIMFCIAYVLYDVIKQLYEIIIKPAMQYQRLSKLIDMPEFYSGCRHEVLDAALQYTSLENIIAKISDDIIIDAVDNALREEGAYEED
jgi:hypothetical protein